MLGTKDATVTLAVKDVKKARKFYEDTLGLKRVDGNADWVAYKSGNSTIMCMSPSTPEPTRLRQ